MTRQLKGSRPRGGVLWALEVGTFSVVVRLELEATDGLSEQEHCLVFFRLFRLRQSTRERLCLPWSGGGVVQIVKKLFASDSLLRVACQPVSMHMVVAMNILEHPCSSLGATLSSISVTV